MSNEPQDPQKKRTKLWLALAAIVVIIALIVVPPFISLNNYKTRVTQSLAAALGRPVRLSNVDLRLLPRPGFLLTDLTVQEDPAFGSEPVLHANTVTAAIRFSSLWHGRLQISQISVDEASLNLVRMPDGRWNLDSLFRSTAANAGVTEANLGEPPYMEATSSRINIKDGVEKLPFSLVDADASMWRESNGNWRVRLRGQPARTDVTLDMADTGIVRLEATLHPAVQLSRMPVHLDVDWRQAQLGQLTRLVLGSDEGWRGDLTGELHLDGVAASARVQGRLRASGVHRAEFAPAAPMDFDATCQFTLEYGHRSLDDLVCNSPVGDGRARIMGNLSGGAGRPKLTVELDRVPAQAGLDLLRTMRNTIDPSLQAAGSVSGHMTYDPAALAVATQPSPLLKRKIGTGRTPQTHNAPGPLTGTFTVSGLRISGDALGTPIQVSSMTLEAAPAQQGQPSALTSSVAIPAGGSAPLVITARLALTGFELGVHGTTALSRLREFAHLTGSPAEAALAQLAGQPAILDFTAEGPWVPPADVRLTLTPDAGPAIRSVRTMGTVTLHDANWKAPFLANAVLISTATLHMENGGLLWDPVDFSYGPVKGTATLDVPADCDDPQGCPPKFTLKFAALDAGVVEAALLGAREKGTVLSTLLERLNPNSQPAWPRMGGTATADSLALEPFTLTNVTADLQVKSAGAEATDFDAGLLGGNLHGTATLAAGNKPDYTLEATVTNVNPAQLGQLAGMTWGGGAISGKGKVELAGYTDAELAKSAKGTIHIEWQHGEIAGPSVPQVLVGFDRLSGDAEVADGALTIKHAEAQHGSRKVPVEAAVAFGRPAKVTFGPAARVVPDSAARR
jgi:hypothetical protein